MKTQKSPFAITYQRPLGFARDALRQAHSLEGAVSPSRTGSREVVSNVEPFSAPHRDIPSNGVKIVDMDRIIKVALAEDAAHHDLTTQLTVSSNQTSKALIIFKSSSILCGLNVIQRTFQLLDKNIKVKSAYRDGDFIPAKAIVVELSGKTRAILSGERVSLNFLSYLSGIATKTAEFVSRIKPKNSVVMDTRKTMPGLRSLTRYAVRCGGGINHRNSLEEMIFIKDNHWTAMHSAQKSFPDIMLQARRRTKRKVEVEVENISQFKKVLKHKPDIILLDNMSPLEIRSAVMIRNKTPGGKSVSLEASGGITKKNLLQIALTGVDRISIGALTHSIDAVDVSLELVP